MKHESIEGLINNNEKLDEESQDKEIKNKEEDLGVKEKHKCEDCGRTFRLASGLKTHAIKHGRKLKCEVCKKEFFRKLIQILTSLDIKVDFNLFSC